jgi:hypothetical protein
MISSNANGCRCPYHSNHVHESSHFAGFFGCKLGGNGDTARPFRARQTKSLVKLGRRPVTKISKYRNVRLKGRQATTVRGMLPREEAIEIRIAETAADITTGKTPPSTPQNLIRSDRRALVSRSWRISGERGGDDQSWEKDGCEDLDDARCGK